MKIVISVNTTWNIFNFRLGLIKELQSKGHQVIALAPKDKYVPKLEALGVTCHHVTLNLSGTNPINEINLFWQYYKLFKVIKPDIILSYTIKPNIYGNFAARLLRIHTINNISGLGTIFIRTTLASYIGKILYKLSLSSSFHVFFQNTDDKKLFVKSKLVTFNKCSVIPGSGVNISTFKSERTNNVGKTFLFAGRLIGDKGVFEYLEAATEILKFYPDIKFLLAGELGYNNNTALSKDKLKYYTNNYPQIKYLGKTDNMVSVFESIDVMVLPSYREGLSKSLVEAAAMTLPIITTDVPGCKEVVNNNESGLLCNVKSSVSLVKNMKKMVELNQHERHQMGINGRKIVEKIFAEEHVIRHYLLHINKLDRLINNSQF